MLGFDINVAQLAIYGFLYLLVAFVFVMKVKHKLEGTRWEPVAYVAVIPFQICNWAWNVTAGSAIFWDWPDEFFEVTTSRMKRYKKAYEKQIQLTRLERWRYWFAIHLCRFLNQHDKAHC